jgi:hypothetical protein
MSVKSGDIVYDNGWVINLNSELGKYYFEYTAPDFDLDNKGTGTIIPKEILVELLKTFLKTDGYMVNSVLSVIQQNPESFLEATENNIKLKENKKILPLTPQQVIERKVLDKDISDVNEQIEKTFDGYSARVKNVSKIVRNKFEQFGWVIYERPSEECFVFSPIKEK